VFLTAFILVMGGAVFTVSIAVASSLRAELRRFFGRKGEDTSQPEERSLWSHL
jgi:hypothetical protein